MSMQPYLEQYLDNLENLSPELTRNFKLIYELDLKIQSILKEIDKLKEDYLANSRSFDAECRLQKARLIDYKYTKCKSFSDEKVQLANQTYELVDKYIRRLDTDLIRLEGEFNYNRGTNDLVESAQKTSESAVNSTSAPNNLNNSTGSAETSSKRKKKKKNEKTAPQQGEEAKATPVTTATTQAAASTLVPAIDVLDMPVDPNEPLYCICQQVSYGDMIGCDDTECTIEWFHFGCVGLTQDTKPKGKWYCPICLEKRKRN